MNRHERRKLRAQTRRAGPIPQTEEQRHESSLDRQHMLRHNAKEALAGAKRMAAEKGGRPSDQVVMVLDLRDDVAFRWARDVGKQSEQSLRAHMASCAMNRIVPTNLLAVTRAAAAGLLAHDNPGISESVERLPADHIGIVVIASGGTSLLALPEDATGIDADANMSAVRLEAEPSSDGTES
jgi:hypothetical protein